LDKFNDLEKDLIPSDPLEMDEMLRSPLFQDNLAK
jgi:hypothetical protein